MKHQQMQPRAKMQPSPQAVAMRKGTIRSRPRTRWTTEMDEIEFAHASLSSISRGVVGRDGSNDIRSVANVLKLSMLQEIFPSISVDMLEDVLMAAQFSMDTAASMLSDLSREMACEPTADPELADWAAVQSEEADQWHEVSESRPELQQWVMVQDDWEVVDGLAAHPENVRSYADVLRASVGDAGSTGSLPSLPGLSPSRPAVSTSPLITLQKKDACEMPEDLELDGSKSFGTRKRRFLRKFRA